VLRGQHETSLTFYLVDCLDLLRRMPSGVVDVIVTSPPYNLGIRYNTYFDDLGPTEYLEWTGQWIGEAARVLKPDGSLFLNVGSRPADAWTPPDVAQTGRPEVEHELVAVVQEPIAVDRLVVSNGQVGLQASRRTRRSVVDGDGLDPVHDVLQPEVLPGGLRDVERGPRI